MNSLHLRNGRVIDPSRGLDQVTDLWLSGGLVAGTGPRPADFPNDPHVLDCTGLIVAPGLIDMHVHLREPGREEDETVATGTAAAVAGGVTSVAFMPNTEPALDTRLALEFVAQQAARGAACNVFPVGAVTKAREGKELAPLARLAEWGAVAFTDDGAPVHSAEMMRRALGVCRGLGRAVLVHAEVLELTPGGVMHEGEVSRALGVPGMPAAAEDIMIARDIILAEATGGKVHILHVSTAGGVDLIRHGRQRAKALTAAGKPSFWISGEACPHHFLLTDENLRTRDSNYKMSPPLRSEADRAAVLAGLKDDTLTVLATDHAPHAPDKKAREWTQTPNGILGLETFLPLCVTHLIEPGHLTWPQMLAKMTCNPAAVLGIDRGTLRTGRPADVTVIDPNVRWTIDKEDSPSKSRNTPFHGWEVTGRAVVTIVGGAVKMSRLR
ncbi:MAG: dihydroorotase [Gemmataceae bacterium]|nr:dihydroorotase [Gemmataceae bacterium]